MSLPDRQVVVQLIGGAADATTRGFAASLTAKAKMRGLDARVIEISTDTDTRVEAALAALGTNSRLYVVGVTAPDRHSISGFTPQALAERLLAAGLTRIGKISMVADYAALPEGEDAGEAESLPKAVCGSYAAALHRALGEAGIRTELSARIGSVRVLDASAGADEGRKLGRRDDNAPWQHKPRRGKLIWRWDGALQAVHWANGDESED